MKRKVIDYQLLKNTITLYYNDDTQEDVFFPSFIKNKKNYHFSEKISKQLNQDVDIYLFLESKKVKKEIKKMKRILNDIRSEKNEKKYFKSGF
jgi:tRNA A22 N-methylase